MSKPSKVDDINSFVACSRLQVEIVTLKRKVEQVSSASMNLANRFTKPSSFKNSSKRRFKKKNSKTQNS